MAPNSFCSPTLTTEPLKQEQKTLPQDVSYRTLWGYFLTPLKWGNIIGITLIHIVGIYAYLSFSYSGYTNICTVIWSFLAGWMAGLGVTAGAHRLWTHRAYKAKLPLRILLIMFYAMAGQNTLHEWVRDHRVHHRFSETDADPHNANRGFFFAHVGWLMMRKHPDVLKHGKQVDCSDIYEDPVVRFFEKYSIPMKVIFCFVIPTMVPYLCLHQTFYWSFMSCMARYATGLNVTWSVNSAAHMFGNKPYNKKIQPVENLAVSICSLGEGWHNYHHTFPWDYKAAELGNYHVNATTAFIDLFAKIGWAYDLKTPSKELVQKIVEVHGDGSHKSE